MQPVSLEVWKQKMDNLNARRVSNPGVKPCNTQIGDYKSNINKVKIGSSLLDVGCGGMPVKAVLPDTVKYVGIDPFPIKEGVVNMAIEDCTFEDNSFDTVICFACLDGTIDPSKAIQQMKRVCKNNVLLLTGIDIEPDKYHTHKITMEFLMEQFIDFKLGYKEVLHPKVFLIEFLKP